MPLQQQKYKKHFLGNKKRRTHHRYAFSPRGFELKQLIRILCEHNCALIFTLVADDLTNRCWVLTKTRSFYLLTKKRSLHSLQKQLDHCAVRFLDKLARLAVLEELVQLGN